MYRGGRVHFWLKQDAVRYSAELVSMRGPAENEREYTVTLIRRIERICGRSCPVSKRAFAGYRQLAGPNFSESG